MHVGNIKKPIKNEKNHFTIARTRSGRSEELNCTTFSRYAIFAGNIIFVVSALNSLHIEILSCFILLILMHQILLIY